MKKSNRNFHSLKQLQEIQVVIIIRLNLEFSNQIIQLYCLPIIHAAIQRHDLDLGVNYAKPWEEIEMNDSFQIQYLFVGKLESKSKNYIPNDQIGINIFEENMFGKLEFDHEHILSLTLIINKKDSTNN